MSNDFSLRCSCCNQSRYDWNFTHNLGLMAREAGIYQALWHPNKDYTDTWEEGYVEINTAAELLPILEAGYNKMVANPSYYRTFNPTNGWGSYDGFIGVIAEIIEACKSFPNLRPYANI